MKKFFLFLATAALTVSFAACNKTEKAPETQEATETAEVITPAPATTTEEPAVETKDESATTKTVEDTLKEFEQFVKAYAEANNNKAKDIQKYQELAIQSTEWAKKVGALKNELNAKQTERLNKALTTLKEINTIK